MEEDTPLQIYEKGNMKFEVSPSILFRKEACKKIEEAEKEKKILISQLGNINDRISTLNHRLSMSDFNLINFLYCTDDALSIVEGWKSRLRTLSKSSELTIEYRIKHMFSSQYKNFDQETFVISSIFEELGKGTKMELEACILLGITYTRENINLKSTNE